MLFYSALYSCLTWKWSVMHWLMRLKLIYVLKRGALATFSSFGLEFRPWTKTHIFNYKTSKIHCTFYSQVEIPSQNCFDYHKRGFKSDGHYTIYDFKTNDLLSLYCYMTSEAGSVWALVLSYALHWWMEKWTRLVEMQWNRINPWPRIPPTGTYIAWIFLKRLMWSLSLEQVTAFLDSRKITQITSEQLFQTLTLRDFLASVSARRLDMPIFVVTNAPSVVRAWHR